MELTVIIPAHNPRLDYIQAVLEGLRVQSLDRARWELLVVDNRSEPPLAGQIDLSWHPHATVVREEALGLTRARAAGFSHAKGELIVLCDDDNLLDPDYLEQAIAIGREYPQLGSWSGLLTLRFEYPALAPPPELARFLTARQADRDLWSNDVDHHASTPWGAGLCIRRRVCEMYLRKLESQPERARLDLQGTTLVYGGDTDIAYTGCELGMGKGVFVRLHITHLIPKRRCERAFLLRSVEGQGYSEVLHGYLSTGLVREPRRDLIGKVGELVRWFTLRPVQRAIAAARRRGQQRAVTELMALTRKNQ